MQKRMVSKFELSPGKTGIEDQSSRFLGAALRSLDGGNVTVNTGNGGVPPRIRGTRRALPAPLKL